MGLFGSIFGKVKGVLGGGGSSAKGYTSPYTGENDTALNTGLYNRVGATSTMGPDGKPKYDYSGVGKNISMPEATSQYDFGNLNQAAAGFKNPFQYHFADNNMIDDAAKNEYDLGSKDINRSGQSQLQGIQRALGARRPGCRAGETSPRPQRRRNAARTCWCRIPIGPPPRRGTTGLRSRG